MLLCQRVFEMKDVSEYKIEVAESAREFISMHDCRPNLLVANPELLNQIDNFEMANELICSVPQMITKVLVDGYEITICADDDMGDKDFKLINDPVAIISSRRYSRADWAEVVCARMRAFWHKLDPDMDVKCLYGRSRIWFILYEVEKNRTDKIRND